MLNHTLLSYLFDRVLAGFKAICRNSLMVWQLSRPIIFAIGLSCFIESREIQLTNVNSFAIIAPNSCIVIA